MIAARSLGVVAVTLLSGLLPLGTNDGLARADQFRLHATAVSDPPDSWERDNQCRYEPGCDSCDCNITNGPYAATRNATTTNRLNILDFGLDQNNTQFSLPSCHFIPRVRFNVMGRYDSGRAGHIRAEIFIRGVFVAERHVLPAFTSGTTCEWRFGDGSDGILCNLDDNDITCLHNWTSDPGAINEITIAVSRISTPATSGVLRIKAVRIVVDTALRDADGDGWSDCEDNCPFTNSPNRNDTDGDGAGDVCDSCTDTDRDGWGNPGFPNPGCGVDNCPSTSNPNQANADGDGLGDACDPCTDTDGDGFGNPGLSNPGCPGVDNCPNISNPNQANFDGDAFGDACDNDIDNDGATNDVDPNDYDPHRCGDGDNDGCDDCVIGRDGIGPQDDRWPANDGPDLDGNGLCDMACIGGTTVPNDCCTNAASLALGTNGFDTRAARPNAPLVHGDVVYNDVWYILDFCSNSTLRIDGCADFPATLFVYYLSSSGTCPPIGEQPGMVDGIPACGSPQFVTTLSGGSGTRLLLRIGSLQNTSGIGQLLVSDVGSRPANACCELALQTGDASLLFGSVETETREAWYRYVAPVSGSARFVAEPFDFLQRTHTLPRMRIYDSCGGTLLGDATSMNVHARCDSACEPDCFDPEGTATDAAIQLPVNAGQSYWIRISETDQTGGFVLRIQSDPLRAPTILEQPMPQVRCVGASVSFNCRASASPPPAFQWYLNGNPIAGAVQPTLTFTVDSPARAGEYRCRASNAAGGVWTLAAFLNVPVPCQSANLQLARRLAAGLDPISLAAARTNSQSQFFDLGVANFSGDPNANSASVFVGRNAGQFGARQDYGMGPHPRDIAAGVISGISVGGDDLIDFALATEAGLWTLVNRGDGTFLPTYNAPLWEPLLTEDRQAVAIGDANAGGENDAMAMSSTRRPAGQDVGTRLGDGGGTGIDQFGNPTEPDDFGNPTDLPEDSVGFAFANFGGDARLEMVLVRANPAEVELWDNCGTSCCECDNVNGTCPDFLGWTFSRSLSAGNQPTRVITGMFNNDGLADFAVTNREGRSISVYLSPGFARTDLGLSVRPWGIAASDLNGDGRVDLAVTADNPDGTAFVLVLANTGAGVFAVTQSAPLPGGCEPRGVAVADLNADGWFDLAVAAQGSDEVLVLWNHAPPPPCPADLDGDRIVTVQDLSMLLSRFAQPGPLGDIDQDGDVDLQDMAYLLADFGEVCP